MNVKFLSVAGAVAVSVMSVSVQAADFTGFRSEARIGWDRTSYNAGDVVGSTTSSDVSEDGFSYGVAFGYDHAVSESVTIGLEAAADLYDNESSGKIGTASYTLEPKRDLELSARLGTKVSDSVLLYGKLGYSNARVEARVTRGNATLVEAANGDGVRVGAGLELALTPQFFAKAEYRYTNYEAGVSRNQLLTGLGFRF